MDRLVFPHTAMIGNGIVNLKCSLGGFYAQYESRGVYFPPQTNVGGVVMKIDYIREYLVLTQEMNFTAAAKKLFLTQPALSRHIAALEDHLGIRLLERTTHSVSLTPAGREVIDHFERISHEYDEVLHHLSLINDGFENEFNVALLINSVNKYATPILSYMNRHFPKTRVRLSVVSTEELFSGAISGEFDVCLSLRDSYKGDDYLRFHTIKSEPLSLMMPQGHRLSKLKAIPVDRLKKETLVFTNEGSSYRANVLDKLSEFGVQPADVRYTTQTLSLAEACLRNDACAIVIDEMKLMEIPGCDIIPFAEEEMAFDLCWMYNALNSNPIIPQFVHDLIIK